MKFHFNIFICIFITSSLYARDVILIENKASPEEGKLLIKILQEKFNIPGQLITYKNIHNPCTQNSDAIMHLCLLENGEMEIIKMNRSVVENTLGAFGETEGQ